MQKRLVVVNGHPDPRPERFCAALAQAYAEGAAGWQVDCIAVGALALSGLAMLKTDEVSDPEIDTALARITGADHLALIYPLWFERPPEGVITLFSYLARHHAPRRADLVVTMNAPAFAYRSALRDGVPMAPTAVPGLTAPEPVLIGCVGSIGPGQRLAWLETVRALAAHRRGLHAPKTLENLTAVLDSAVLRWLRPPKSPGFPRAPSENA